MIQNPRCPIQTYYHTDNQKARCNDTERVLIRQADGEDGGCEFPRCGIEGVGEPVGYEGVDGPFPIAASNGVEI